MGNQAMSREEAESFKRLWDEFFDRNGGTTTDFARALGISRTTLVSRRERTEQLLGIALTPRQALATPENAEELQRRAEAIREERAEKSELLRLRAREDEVKRLQALFQGALDHVPAPPTWLHKETLKPKCLGTPTLFLSDLHWGENVDPKQVNGVNTYDIEIARKRLRRIVDTTLTMLYTHLHPGGYPGMVLALGGDIVSGNIHEELRETNDMAILAIVLDAVDHLIAAIETLLASGVPHIFVPCVVGNHGRLDKKPRAKGAVQDNFEWIIYQLLLRHFAHNKRVTVVPSDSLDYVYRVHNTTYLLTHGDQFRGGSGISGPATPWALGDHKKRKRQNAVAQPYDYMIFGHFHMLTWGQTYIVNGSLKGYDEWSFRMNFGFEPPQQALWITHPRHGITVKMEIGAEDGDGAVKETPWVRVRGG